MVRSSTAPRRLIHTACVIAMCILAGCTGCNDLRPEQSGPQGQPKAIAAASNADARQTTKQTDKGRATPWTEGPKAVTLTLLVDRSASMSGFDTSLPGTLHRILDR